MDALRIECPACHGSGTQTNMNRSGDPQLETVGECQANGCEGGFILVNAEQVEEIVASLLFTVRGPVANFLSDGMARRSRNALRAAGIEP